MRSPNKKLWISFSPWRLQLPNPLKFPKPIHDRWEHKVLAHDRSWACGYLTYNRPFSWNSRDNARENSRENARVGTFKVKGYVLYVQRSPLSPEWKSIALLSLNNISTNDRFRLLLSPSTRCHSHPLLASTLGSLRFYPIWWILRLLQWMTCTKVETLLNICNWSKGCNNNQ